MASITPTCHSSRSRQRHWRPELTTLFMHAIPSFNKLPPPVQSLWSHMMPSSQDGSGTRIRSHRLPSLKSFLLTSMALLYLPFVSCSVPPIAIADSLGASIPSPRSIPTATLLGVVHPTYASSRDAALPLAVARDGEGKAQVVLIKRDGEDGSLVVQDGSKGADVIAKGEKDASSGDQLHSSDKDVVAAGEKNGTADGGNPVQEHTKELTELARELGFEDLSQLSPEQIIKLEERLKFRSEHKGHEKQHAQMALILMGGLVFSQFLLLFWKKAHPKSFQLASLVGLWLVPPAIGFSAGNSRYALFETPMQSSTPKLVYKWYSNVYKASVAVGATGYIIVVVTFFRLPYALFGISELTELSMFKRFCGSYFRQMAMRTGYFNRTGFPKKHLRPNVCAICGDSTDLGRTGGKGGGRLLAKKTVVRTAKRKSILRRFSTCLGYYANPVFELA
ncbi:hypothetical protein BC829DRAFT_486220 [Chytridium lagenaria]|nr:hypothetical protein BC829DRAFT_486220 [Chytridium lagenaria]